MKRQIIIGAVVGSGLGLLVLLVAILLTRDRSRPAEPPGPAAPQPAAVANPGPGPMGAPVQSGNVKGDFAFAVALGKLGLSDAQKKILAPMEAAADQEREALLQAHRDKIVALAQELKAARDKAKQAGIRPPDSDPEVKALTERFQAERQKSDQELEGQLARWREKATALIVPLMREEQARKFKLWDKRMVLLHGPGGGLPARGYPNDGFVPYLEEDFLLQFAPGVDLTQEQYQQAIAALKPLVEQYKTATRKYSNLVALLPEPLQKDPNSPEAQQAMRELGQQRTAAAEPITQAMRKAVQQVLTPEQRRAAAENQRNR
jgi:hypothetical protein